MVGTAEHARLKIKHYFHHLRENLNRQEIAALAAVDTHIREKLCMLRQQQEDMAILLSQIQAVCLQCEATLQQVINYRGASSSVGKLWWGGGGGGAMTEAGRRGHPTVADTGRGSAM